MYAKRIIPCLDVKNGRVVKGVSFVDLVDAGDPVACAAACSQRTHSSDIKPWPGALVSVRSSSGGRTP